MCESSRPILSISRELKLGTLNHLQRTLFLVRTGPTLTQYGLFSLENMGSSIVADVALQPSNLT